MAAGLMLAILTLLVLRVWCPLLAWLLGFVGLTAAALVSSSHVVTLFCRRRDVDGMSRPYAVLLLGYIARSRACA
jgi:hypothetical protein